MKYITLGTLFLLFEIFPSQKILLPFNATNRRSIDAIQLTEIGAYGIMRKARPTVPAHYHTGIDIKRPTNNYKNEVIFPIAEGVVISMRSDGPYAQLIIEHQNDLIKFWTVYEHVSRILVKVNDKVDPYSPIARFMNRDELNRYGWQFNHFHLEILKVKPYRIKPDHKNPQRLFNSYSLICYTKSDLEKYFYDPILFLTQHFKLQ